MQALRQGWLGGVGAIGRLVEEALYRFFSVRHALLINSCTSALEIALKLLAIAGGEVILPSFAFPAAAAAIVSAGSRPVFVDLGPIQLRLDPGRLEAALSPKTRAIVHVDYDG